MSKLGGENKQERKIVWMVGQLLDHFKSITYDEFSVVVKAFSFYFGEPAGNTVKRVFGHYSEAGACLHRHAGEFASKGFSVEKMVDLVNSHQAKMKKWRYEEKQEIRDYLLKKGCFDEGSVDKFLAEGFIREKYLQK